MKQTRVTVLWREGLHARPAAKLVKMAKSFSSTISLKVNERITDARSILGVLLLCASMGTVVDLEVSGEDEEDALAGIASVFNAGDFEYSKEGDPDVDLMNRP